MRERIKVGAASLNQTPLDWEGNFERIIRASFRAKRAGISVLCLPELCLTGYGIEDMVRSPSVQERALEYLHLLSRNVLGGVMVAVGLPVSHRGTVYNCTALVKRGEVLGVVPKQNLATDGVHYESRWYEPWRQGAHDVLKTSGFEAPFGDLIFEDGGVCIGFEICEDAWTGERPGASLSRQGVNLILNPSCSHFSFGKHLARRRLVEEGSRAFDAAYVYANHVGNEAGRIIYDGGCMVAAGGEVLAEGRRFSERRVNVTAAEIDLVRIAASKSEKAFGDGEREARRVPVDVPSSSVTESLPETAGYPSLTKEREFSEAVSLGLSDYVSKSGMSGYVISLSGGADSAACAILAALSAVRDGHAVEDKVTTVYQGAESSSEESRQIASELADQLGTRHLDTDVSRVVAEYESVFGDALGKEWDWEGDDIVRQNIQARARGPGAWMVANDLSQILLVTSNRSEAAVGYATMDGDTCGGLAPIAGVDKAFLMKWLNWVASGQLAELGDLPAVSRILGRKPSAELRPEDSGQTDEDDLMPYEVLDRIEREFVLHGKSPAQIAECLNINGTSPDEAREWVRKFFTLWCRNQWKRERYAPAFHLDDSNVDPRSFFRFPILSSFKVELEEMG